LTKPWFIRTVFVVQFLCASFFVWDIFVSYVGLRSRPIAWEFREFIEIGAAIGLILGVVLGAIALVKTQAQSRRLNDQLRAASGAFAELLEERFEEWGLTPAERDVAWFAVKGLSTQEIAALRNTSEGTVKAQSNAIYRKAGVSGRYQLLSQFVDELMAGASEIRDDRDNGRGRRNGRQKLRA